MWQCIIDLISDKVNFQNESISKLKINILDNKHLTEPLVDNFLHLKYHFWGDEFNINYFTPVYVKITITKYRP